MTRHSNLTDRKAVALRAASTALALLAALVSANLMPRGNARSAHFLVTVTGQQNPQAALPARRAEPSG